MACHDEATNEGCHLHSRISYSCNSRNVELTIGPINTVALNVPIAIPRCTLLKISAYTAATTLNGHAPNNPAKKRHIRTVCKSFPVATARLKTEKPNEPTSNGSLRPYS